MKVSTGVTRNITCHYRRKDYHSHIGRGEKVNRNMTLDLSPTSDTWQSIQTFSTNNRLEHGSHCSTNRSSQKNHISICKLKQYCSSVMYTKTPISLNHGFQVGSAQPVSIIIQIRVFVIKRAKT